MIMHLQCTIGDALRCIRHALQCYKFPCTKRIKREYISMVQLYQCTYVRNLHSRTHDVELSYLLQLPVQLFLFDLFWRYFTFFNILYYSSNRISYRWFSREFLLLTLSRFVFFRPELLINRRKI